MQSFRPLITLTISLVLTGCLKPRQKDEVQEAMLRHHQTQMNASFYVGRAITGQSYDHDSVEGWSIPEMKYYNFRACLSDRITNDRIIGHRFEIVGDDQMAQGQVVQTDDEGCLQWNEYIPFNYFSYEAKYLTINREIRGVGVHSGAYQVQLAFNPWRASRGGNTPEIIDLARGSLPQEQVLSVEASRQFIQGQFSRTLPVEVKDLSVAIQSRQAVQNGNEIEIHMSMSPQVVFNNIFGERVIHRIRQGEFDVFFQIVASSTRDDKSDLYLISEPLRASMVEKNLEDSTVIRFQDDKIDVQFTTTLQNRMTHGHYDLVLRLVPRGVTGLGEFYGVYRFGEHHALLSSRGGLRPMISNLESPQAAREFEDKLDQVKRDNLGANSGDVRELEPYQFEHMKIAFMRVLPNETTTQRSIAYRSEVCIRRALDGRLVQFEDFLIKKSDGTEVTVNTESEGCLAWIDSISHQYYQPETIIQKSAEVTHLRSGFKKELSAYINPWDYGWTFGQDARKIPQSYIDEVNNRDPIISQLFIPGYGYETIRFRYEIDKFLNLNVKKTLLLDISPRVLRYSSITRGLNATESLRDGVYLMKVAIQKDYYDPRTPGLTLKQHPEIPGRITVESSHNKEVEFINTVEKLVRVKQGRIITPVEFSVNDLRLMRVRSNFLVEISPIDEARLGITPNVRLSSIDLSAFVSNSEGLSTVERTAPRLSGTTPHQYSGNYVLRDQLFSDRPFDVLNAEVSSIMAEDQGTQRSVRGSIDLDQFVVDDAGLPTRTFVGPIILLSNSWGAGLRPTDELEEMSECDNLSGEEKEACEQEEQQKSEMLTFDNDPLVARFYGSTKHLEDVSVSELMEREYSNKLEYENQQTYESLLSRYVKEFYLDFVSLSNEQLKVLPLEDEAMKVIDLEGEVKSFTELAQHICGSDKIEDCLQESAPETDLTKELLISKLNFQTQDPYRNMSLYRNIPEFTQADLKEFIINGEGDEHLGTRFCHLWVETMLSGRYGYDVREQNRAHHSSLSNIFSASPLNKFQFALNNCTRNVRRYGLESVFNLNRLLRPNRVEGYRFKGGKSLNFNVGASFSLGFGESMSTNISSSFDPLDILESLPVVGKFIGGVLGVFSVKQGSSASQSRNIGIGTSVSSGTYLAMQKASMDLYFNEYEHCVEIRAKREFLADRETVNFVKLLPEEKRVDALSRGLFLCSGEKSREPVPFQEQYYYFTQHFTEGDMLDNGDLLNHPWLLALRGERNYAHFINLIQATPQTDRRGRDFDLRWLPNQMLQPYLDHAEEVMNVPDEVSLGERPLDQMIEAYNLMPPTFPGLYMIRPSKLEYPQ